jgi:predicted ATPase
MSERNKISRVILRNYKSIRKCDVALGPITFLVGPNGAGKSNFVEALRFLSYGLSNSLEGALENRTGFRSIVHRQADKTPTILIDVFFGLEDERIGNFLVEIGALQDGTATVIREECTVKSAQGSDWFKVERGVVTSNQGLTPAASPTKLYLVNASGLAAFEPVYRALSSMLVYNPVPDEIRGAKAAKGTAYLNRPGSNLAETIFKLKATGPDRLARVLDYLRRISPSVLKIEARAADGNYYLRFELGHGNGAGEEFHTQNISDGTLRALAVLTALFQQSDRSPLTLIGLEEPEAGLHPAAAGVLFDSLVEASQLHQIVVTSHSPDLLDRDDIPENSLKAVEMLDGCTIIGEADDASKAALRQRLYTVGELMRMGQLRPEVAPDCTNAR